MVVASLILGFVLGMIAGLKVCKCVPKKCNKCGEEHCCKDEQCKR